MFEAERLIFLLASNTGWADAIPDGVMQDPGWLDASPDVPMQVHGFSNVGPRML